MIDQQPITVHEIASFMRTAEKKADRLTALATAVNALLPKGENGENAYISLSLMVEVLLEEASDIAYLDPIKEKLEAAQGLAS